MGTTTPGESCLLKTVLHLSTSPRNRSSQVRRGYKGVPVHGEVTFSKDVRRSAVLLLSLLLAPKHQTPSPRCMASSWQASSRTKKGREQAPICLFPGQASLGEPLQPGHPPHQGLFTPAGFCLWPALLQLPSLLLLLSVLCPGLPEAACQCDCVSGLCPGHRGLQLPVSCCPG